MVEVNRPDLNVLQAMTKVFVVNLQQRGLFYTNELKRLYFYNNLTEEQVETCLAVR